jgi:hypothetical protein
VCVGTGFPLRVYLAFPLAQVREQFLCFLCIDGISDRTVQIFLAQHQRQILPPEEQLRECRFLLTREAAFANRLNLSNAVVRMVNGIALMDFDELTPATKTWLIKNI